jgi:hypothetical protein
VIRAFVKSKTPCLPFGRDVVFHALRQGTTTRKNDRKRRGAENAEEEEKPLSAFASAFSAPSAFLLLEFPRSPAFLVAFGILFNISPAIQGALEKIVGCRRIGQHPFKLLRRKRMLSRVHCHR